MTIPPPPPFPSDPCADPRSKIPFADGFDRIDLIFDHVGLNAPDGEDLRVSANRFMAACRADGHQVLSAEVARSVYENHPELKEPL